MNYWGRKEGKISIECEKCKKVFRIAEQYFEIGSNYVKPKTMIKCLCGSASQETMYAKDTSNYTNQVKCPRCGSTQIQMINRKWSLITGFLTNKVDRVCLRCKKRF